MSRGTGLSAFGPCLAIVALLLLQAAPAAAFGAGNIASISKIEGHNWRHGDIEDMLKTVAFLRGHKWTSMMVKRVYFGNWLRDYSQAVDVGTLKGVQSGTIRILVWVLSFLSFGYATGEFEVTEERLGVYRPEEHIDNPKDYADNVDARQYDPRLRPPVQPIELQIDPQTGMKNYIANERLNIATSAGYVKYSFIRSIHFGRVYTSGASGTRGKDVDLYEALRCLGQGLHCLEDFGAHTNYTELALRELGYRNVFTHTGTATEIDLRGRRVFPLVTGTFGAVDFLHSVLGEATDHFAQTEVEQMDTALGSAQMQTKKSTEGGARTFAGPDQQASYLTSLLSQVPGTASLCQQAEQLQAQSQAQSQAQEQAAMSGTSSETAGLHGNTRDSRPGFAAPPGSINGPPGPGIPGMSPNFDPVKTAAQIYPILEFRDKVVKAISATIERIPGLNALVEKITETLTLFVLSLLAPFIRPIINAVSAQLKAGSSSVVDASGKHQYEPWTDPYCTDPTHSLLSKDHFSNVLNGPAGAVASAILQYVSPRIVYAWQHPAVPVDQVLNDIVRVFHHPAIRDPHCELHRNMFDVVERWAHSQPNRGADLNNILSSDGVRQGKNDKGSDNRDAAHNHGGLPVVGNLFGSGSHSNAGGAPWEKMLNFGSSGRTRDMAGLEDTSEGPSSAYPGTGTGYDTTRSEFSPERYQSPTYQQGPSSAFQQDSYSPSPYQDTSPAQQPFNPYGASAEQYQQDYAQPYQGSLSGEPYSPQGYPSGPPYGYDPNAPPPQPEQPEQYGYEGYGSQPPSYGRYHGGAPY